MSAVSDHTTKDLFGDGYTTYHDDGTTTHHTKDIFGDGWTSYRSDGTVGHTTKDLLGGGYTTYTSGGSSSAPSLSATAGYGAVAEALDTAPIHPPVRDIADVRH